MRCSRIVRIGLVILAFILGGCAVRPMSTSGPPRGEERPPGVAFPDRSELFDVLSGASERKRSFKALVHLRVQSGKAGIAKFQAVIWAQRPDRVRVIGLTPFGGTFFDLGMSGDVFELYLPSSSEVWDGRVQTLASIGTFKGLEALRDAWSLAGLAPDGFLESWDRVSIVAEGSEAVLSMPDGKDRIWLDSSTLDLVREEHRGPGGDVERLVTVRGYAESPTGRHPSNVMAADSSGDTVELLVKEWIWNPATIDQEIVPSVPVGVARRRLTKAPS